MYYAMVACCIQMYSFMGHIPTLSKESSTNENSHPSFPDCQSDITAILWTTQWWNTYSNFNIASINTLLSLPYSITYWTTTLYIFAHARIVYPILFSTFDTTIHHRCALLRLPHRDPQSLLSNATVRPKYGKSAVESRGSRLTWMVTLLSSKQCYRVSLLSRCISPSQNCYVV